MPCMRMVNISNKVQYLSLRHQYISAFDDMNSHLWYISTPYTHIRLSRHKFAFYVTYPSPEAHIFLSRHIRTFQSMYLPSTTNSAFQGIYLSPQHIFEECIFAFHCIKSLFTAYIRFLRHVFSFHGTFLPPTHICIL